MSNITNLRSTRVSSRLLSGSAAAPHIHQSIWGRSSKNRSIPCKSSFSQYFSKLGHRWAPQLMVTSQSTKWEFDGSGLIPRGTPIGKRTHGSVLRPMEKPIGKTTHRWPGVPKTRTGTHGETHIEESTKGGGRPPFVEAARSAASSIWVSPCVRVCVLGTLGQRCVVLPTGFSMGLSTER